MSITDDKVKLRKSKGKIEAFCFDCDKWKDETKCFYFENEGYICLRCLDKRSKNKLKKPKHLNRTIV